MLCGVFFSCTTYFIVSDTDFFSPFYKSLHRTNLHSGYPLRWATELKNPIPTLTVGTVFLALLFSFPACPFTFFLPCCVSQRCCLVSVPQHHLPDSFPIPPQSSSLQWSLPSTSSVTNSRLWWRAGSPQSVTSMCHWLWFSLFPHLNPSAVFYRYRGTAFRQTSGLWAA